MSLAAPFVCLICLHRPVIEELLYVFVALGSELFEGRLWCSHRGADVADLKSYYLSWVIYMFSIIYPCPVLHLIIFIILQTF